MSNIKLLYQLSIPMDNTQYEQMLDRLLDIDICYYFDGDSLVFDGVATENEANELLSKVVSWL